MDVVYRCQCGNKLEVDSVKIISHGYGVEVTLEPCDICAAQQSVQADENTAEAFIANFIEFINDVYLHEEDRQKVLGFLRQRSRR